MWLNLLKYLHKKHNYFFPGSQVYWERRYSKNGNSGIGSYGEKAAYKAYVLNGFVEKNKIQTVIELGCGDGNQLKQFKFPRYIGTDVSPSAIKICKEVFKEDKSKQFFLCHEKTLVSQLFESDGELALSLDVIYHLIEDDVYRSYMHNLFSVSRKFVIIYAWDMEGEKKYHVRHRKFSKWIQENIPDFQLIERITQPPFCEFFIYQRLDNSVRLNTGEPSDRNILNAVFNKVYSKQLSTILIFNSFSHFLVLV